MSTCTVCRKNLTPGEGRTFSSGDVDVTVHERCLSEFELLVEMVLREHEVSPSRGSVERLARVVNDNLVLTYRKFPNDQYPLLVYLAHAQDAVPVSDVYDWLRRNELDIKNPSMQVHRLRDKGLISVFDEDGVRNALITEAGRRLLEDYVESLAENR